MRTVNHNLNFVPEVELKKGDTCSLKRHFRGCTREVIGYLDLLAKNNPQRFAYCRVVNIVKHCKRYKGKKYSKSMVEVSVAYLRQHWFITTEVELRVNYGIERPGFFVLPHDLLFRRAGNVCSLLDRETQWNAFKIWLKSTVESTVKSTGQSTGESTVQSMVPTTQNEVLEYANEYGAEKLLAVETTEPIREEQEKLRQVCGNGAAANRGTESVGLTERTVESVKPGAPTSDQASVTENQKQKGNPSALSSSKTDRPKPEGQTIAQYFSGVADRDLIYTLSNTRITPDPKTYRHWEALVDHCKAAVAKRGSVQVTSNALADIMGAVMDTCRAEGSKDPPREWHAAMKKMREGEPLLCVPTPLVDSDPTVTGVPHLFQGFSLDEFVEELEPFGYDRFKSYRDGWKFLYELVEKRGDKPAAMIAARDEMYDRDHSPDKPPAPWKK